jgi:alkylation response protein AidB-like acyl-CoA dehydrogenase
LAITGEHAELAQAVAAFLDGVGARAANRRLQEAPAVETPPFWGAFAELGYLGVHLPEAHGGGGAGLVEAAIVAEQLGATLAPGPFVPSMAAAAVLAAFSDDVPLPALARGESVAAIATGGSVALEDGVLSGDSAVLGGAAAEFVLFSVGDDVALIRTSAAGVTLTMPSNLDASRPSARLHLDGVTPEALLPGASDYTRAVLRLLVAAEAVGAARACVDMATEYATVREQFGRTIGTFGPVKHHLANMLVAAEIATAAVWDAARAAEAPAAEFSLAAAGAAVLAIDALAFNADLNVQVHGGIGYTWEHDAHLFQRRSYTLRALVSPDAAAREVAALRVAGTDRAATLSLPPEAEAARGAVRELADELAALPADQQRARLVETGYLQPHWPEPWGIAASAGVQLVIDEEFRTAGVRRPGLGITGWVVLTLVQHATPEQVERWVRPALAGAVWCQLFSEPSAGSDAAAIRTSATRAESWGTPGIEGVAAGGGWIVNGQKVWTSDAQYASWGLATVRTDSSGEKHAGITMMAIDMAAPGVEVRPLRQCTGDAHFNEVFFTDVFVPDSDVVGTPGAGWTVARATLGNERVSIGGDSGMTGVAEVLAAYAALAEKRDDVAVRVGRHLAEELALRQANLRRAERAVTGAEAGPEGNVTKLVLGEHAQRARALIAEFAGAEAAFVDGPLGSPGLGQLAIRALTIAGGTSEIARNQIGERILGLPRDPLIR